MESDPLAPRRSSQIGSRLSTILQELQKRQVAENSPPSDIQEPKRRRGVPEVVVAVMGVTGAGKSSFIRRVTGNDGVLIGSGLQSSEDFDIP
jgi:hypothetical protein